MSVLAGPTLPTAVSYQLDVQRRAAPGALGLGVAVELGSPWDRYNSADGHNVHAVGAAGFVAKEHRGTRWFVDVTGGAGVELAHEVSEGGFNGPTCAPATQCPAYAPNVVSPQLNPYLFFRATFSAGVTVTSRCDLVVRVTGHLSADELLMSFVGASAGLRFRMP